MLKLVKDARLDHIFLSQSKQLCDQLQYIYLPHYLGQWVQLHMYWEMKQHCQTKMRAAYKQNEWLHQLPASDHIFITSEISMLSLQVVTGTPFLMWQSGCNGKLYLNNKKKKRLTLVKTHARTDMPDWSWQGKQSCIPLKVATKNVNLIRCHNGSC